MVHNLLSKFKKIKSTSDNTTKSLIFNFLLRNLSFFNIDLMTVTEKDNTIIIEGYAQ